MQKADLQPLGGANPDHVAGGEIVIQLNSERYWLYAAVDPATNRLLHVWLYPTRTQALTEMFLSEFRENHPVADAIFLVDGARGCRPPVTDTGSDSSMKPTGIGIASNISLDK